MAVSESTAAALSSVCCFQLRGFFLLIAIASTHGIKAAAAAEGGGVGVGGDEFCQWEIFQADCPGPDEVLLMTEAFYGRMRLGRCIQRDFGFIDCGVNVLPVVGRFCSARRRCSFSVTTLHGNHNCPMDLTAYLATKYTCLKITQCRPSFCQKTETIRLSSSVDGGYLSGGVGMAPGVGGGGGGPCGSLNCPWRLEAEPGQRINLTLLDFSSSSSSSSSSDASAASASSPSSASSSDTGPSTVCYRYASIRDGAVLKDLTGCSRPEPWRTIATKRPAHGEQLQQQQHHSNSAGYLTEGNSVQITLYTSHSNSVHFLIRYQAFGCPTIQPPTNSRADREEHGGGRGEGRGGGESSEEGEQLVIRCLHSDQVYRLRCTGSSWVGQVGSCDSPLVNNQENGNPEDAQNRANKSPSLGVLVIVGLGIVIGVAIGFTLLVVVTCCIRRSSRANPSANQLSSPVYWKTQSELVYHEDVYSCNGDHSSSLSPIDRDYTVTKAIPYSTAASAATSTGPLPASTAALTSGGGGYSATDYFSADCPRRKSTVTHVVLKSRPITPHQQHQHQQQQQQQQCNLQEHQKGSSARLKEHLYEMPVAPSPVEIPTEFTAIDCSIGHCTSGIATNDKPNTYF